MNVIPSFLWLRFAVITILAAGSLSSVSPLPAQSILNPSFEADAFAVAPGYISANAPVTGWTVGDGTKAGLNPAGGQSLFANNGVVPNGSNVVFMHATNYLSTVISGLTIGTDYKVQFRVNSQNGSRPNIRVALDGGPTVFDAGSVVSVGGTLPYKYVAFNFIASASSQTLYLTNDTAVGGTTNVLLLDDFIVGVSTSGWSYAAWTDDASSGVDSTKNYTHAYSFGAGAATTPFTINGVTFTRLATVDPRVPYELMTVGLSSQTTDAGNVLKTAGGGSAILASQFVYNANPAFYTLHNLVPGKEYVATWYTVGWDGAGKPYGRSVTWLAGDDRLSINQNHLGENVGLRMSYRYIAPASGFITISNLPFSIAIGSLHTYGLANYEVAPQTVPVIGVQPASKSSLAGSGAGFYVTAGGARPLGYRWLKDGVEMANQTNRVLLLTNLTAADLAQYSVAVSNGFGIVTSSSAGLTFSTATFANPSFEGETYMTWPGYVAGNFPIPGWFISNAGRLGLSLADGLSPFVNNGAVPDGRNVALLQNAGAVSNSISTILSGLTPGQTSRLDFAVNARAGQKPNLHLSIDGQSLSDILLSSVNGTNPYKRVYFDFVPTSTSAVLALTNDAAGDTTALLDDFHLVPTVTRWSYDIWTNDASSGVDGSKFYTHAFNFGTAADAVVNGVLFKGTAGINPANPGQYSTAGFGSLFSGDVNALTIDGGGSAGLAQHFMYGGPVQTIALTNLVPGIEYVATIYSVGFDPRATGRAATFSVGGDRLTVNQDHFGNDVGIRFSYRYVADASGSIVLSYTPTDASSTIHTYAFANYQVVPSAPVIAAQPASAFVSADQLVSLSVALSAGAQPTSYQWQLNGGDITDQTNSTLLLSNLTVGSLSSYRVIVTNSFGSVTSAVAIIEVGVKFSEVFNTGVDSAGTMLPGGQLDPHYRLISSPDTNYPGPQVLTLTNGVYPVQPGTYVTNGAGALSAWISPSTNTAAQAPGIYIYRTIFVIDTADPAHSQLSGFWASDNEGLAILLNGVNVGVSNLDARPFSRLFPFLITNGFVAGSNILDFVITNLSVGPTGLRAELISVGRPLPPTPPAIVSQPQSRTVRELDDVSFTVLATGSAPLTYQWYFEGIDLPNETNRTLSLTRVSQFDQPGNYWVVVTNPEGQTNSDTAVLTIVVLPTITEAPSSQTVACNGTATFAVVADGTPPFGYQWYFGAGALAGQTNSTLTLSNLSSAQSGSYSVTVSNVAGATNVSAILTVTDLPPVITNCAPNQTLEADETGRALLPDLTPLVNAGDACGAVTVAQAPVAGVWLDVGTTNVVISVTDTATNSVTCNVSVTVEPRVTMVNLAIVRQGTNAVISWPVSAGSFWRLTQTADLTPPRLWTQVANAVLIVGDQRTVTVDAATDQRFFRLEKP